MYVGVILIVIVDGDGLISIPHVCGGDPPYELMNVGGIGYSPCMWG